MTPQPAIFTRLGATHPVVFVCVDCLTVRVDEPGETCIPCRAIRINRAAYLADQQGVRRALWHAAFIICGLLIITICVLAGWAPWK